MKKITALILLLFMLMLSLVLPVNAFAEGEKVAQAVWTDDNKTFTFINSETVYKKGDDFGGHTVTAVWSGDSVTKGKAPWMAMMSTFIETVVFDESFKEVQPTSTNSLFLGMTELSAIEGIENLDTSKVTDMRYMFSMCLKLESIDISTFDFSNVEKMDGIFSYCKKLKSMDISALDISNVKTMTGMFAFCTELKTIYCESGDTDWSKTAGDCALFTDCKNLKAEAAGKSVAFQAGNFKSDMAKSCIKGGYFTPKDPSFNQVIWTEGNSTLRFISSETEYKKGDDFGGQNVTDVWISDDFENTGSEPKWAGCNASEVIIEEKFSRARPTSTARWFKDFKNLKKITGLDNLNTSKVTDMSEMFSGDTSLVTVDLSSFTVTNETNISGMFYYCTALRRIYCADENTDWSGCTSSGAVFMQNKVLSFSYHVNGRNTATGTRKLVAGKERAKSCTKGGYFTPVSEKEYESSYGIGSIFSSGKIALIAVPVIVIAVFAAVVVVTIKRKRKYKAE